MLTYADVLGLMKLDESCRYSLIQLIIPLITSKTYADVLGLMKLDERVAAIASFS